MLGVLEVTGLKKSFGTVRAVDGISFTVQEGEIFTIIGPNGAGKTTTLEMIEGLILPDEGDIFFGRLTWDTNGEEIRRKIGVLPQSGAMFDLLTPKENLHLFASFFPNPRSIQDIMKQINLEEHENKLVTKLSGGQKQRLAIGLAIVSDPDIVFLDEPTTGLDPQARRNIWDIILNLKKEGKTVILTTHYMEEAEKLSDRVCIVDHGKIVAMDSPNALIQRLPKEREISISFFDGEERVTEALQFAKSISTVVRSEKDGSTLTLFTKNPEETLYGLLEYTRENGLRVDRVFIHEMGLEDVFIAYTGKEWRD